MNNTYHIGNFIIPTSSISGIISGINALLYIFLVFIDYKKGIIISSILLLLSFFNLVFGIVKSQSLSSLPGFITNILSFVTIFTIHFFYKRISISNLTDYVTGYGNRKSYVQDIENNLFSRKSFTIACIEVEEFKHINDIYGIKSGDYLLKKIAEKVSSILEKNDKIYRITGSTFIIFFAPGHSPEERLKTIIKSETIIIPSETNSTKTDNTCHVTLRAGIVYSNPPYNSNITPTSILNQAETALFATRKNTENKICIYNETMQNDEIKQREAEYLIKEALDKNYFYQVYQPQYTTSEKKLRGFETLIRCAMPDGSIISPGFLIPAAEKSNLIISIDEYVLRKAMTEFKPMLEKTKEKLMLSINVSAKNISSADFANRILNMVEEIKFPPENLELEITEYSFAESVELTIENINQLRAYGIEIALDDFGTGYTSIKQMMTLPINLLKIDKCLIDDVEENQSIRDIVDSIIYMGHVMNCEVICEGVEKENQLNFLKEHKCDFIQGFIWGKPISLNEVEQLISKYVE